MGPGMFDGLYRGMCVMLCFAVVGILLLLVEGGRLVWHLVAHRKPTPVAARVDPAPCPKRLFIGSYTYELVAGDPGLGDEGEILRGSVNYDREVIIVDPAIPIDLQRETVIHEIEHIAAQQSLQRSADYFKQHKYRDDQWIEATAPILTQTLRRYPELLTCELK